MQGHDRIIVIDGKGLNYWDRWRKVLIWFSKLSTFRQLDYNSSTTVTTIFRKMEITNWGNCLGFGRNHSKEGIVLGLEETTQSLNLFLLLFLTFMGDFKPSRLGWDWVDVHVLQSPAITKAKWRQSCRVSTLPEMGASVSYVSLVCQPKCSSKSKCVLC